MSTSHPGSASDRERTARRKINPATCTEEELLSYLATNPATGLSPKEAARRRDYSMASPLFKTTAWPYLVCLKAALREPALWLFLGISFIALFFDRAALGLACLILGGGHAALCAHFRYRARRLDASMQAAYDTPLCRVRRGRRILRIGADELARGDILLLFKGDLVPADCRLLSARGLSVSEREISGSPDRPVHSLQKDPSAVPEQGGNFRVSPPNMAFAGGIVEEGEGVAVVVAVGSETHLGGLVGAIEPTRAGENTKSSVRAARLLSGVNLALVCLMIPLVAVGIFTLGEHHAFLDIFLAASALSTLMLSEHTLGKLGFMFAAVRRSAALDRNIAASADIKSSSRLETLAGVTDVLLVGTAALHDGMPHPVSLYADGQTYRFDEPETIFLATDVIESLYLCRYGGVGSLHRMTSSDLDAVIAAFAEQAELDVEALMLKAKEIKGLSDGVSYILPTSTGTQRIIRSVTDDPAELYAMAEGADATQPNDNCRRAAALAAAYDRARRDGLRVLILLDGEERLPCALLAYAPATCPKMAGDIRSMTAAGIRVSAFLRDESSEYIPLLRASGLLEEGSMPGCSNHADDSSAFSSLEEGARAFVGCSEVFIHNTIRDLQAAGRTVCVLSVEERDLPLLYAADLAVTCAPSLFVSAESGEICLDSEDATADEQDGRADSVIATDLCRRRADILVRRTTESGGGLAGLRRALFAANAAEVALSRMVTYLLGVTVIRLIMLILPLALGLTLTSAPVLLLSGLGIDTLVMTTLALLPSEDLSNKRRSPEEALIAPLRSNRKYLIMNAASAVAPWIVAAIAVLAGAGIERHLALYGLLNLIGLQLAAFLQLNLPRKDRTVFFTTMAMIFVYIGALAVALADGLHIVWAILIPPIGPLRCVISDGVLKYLTRRKGKKSEGT